MMDEVRIDVHDDGSTTAIVGAAKRTFTGGSERENVIKAIEWADALRFGLEVDDGH